MRSAIHQIWLRRCLVLVAALYLWFCRAQPGLLGLIIALSCCFQWTPSAWTFVRRTLYAPLYLFATNVFYYHLVFTLGLSAVPGILGIFLLIPISLTSPQAKGSRRWIDFRDLLGIIVATCVYISFVPSISLYGASRYLPIPTSGEDVISHFSITDTLLSEEGLIYGKEHVGSWMLMGLAHYPQGFHLTAATLARYFETGHKRGHWAMAHHWIALTSLSILLLTFYYLCCASLDVLRFERGTSGFALLIVPIFLTAVSGFVVLPMYLSSFFGQLTGVFLLSGLLGLLPAQLRWRTLSRRPFLLVPLGLLDASISATWFFLTPVSAAYTFCCVAPLAYRGLQRRYSVRVLSLGLGGTAIHLLYLYFPLSHPAMNVSALNAVGGIHEPSAFVRNAFLWCALLGICLSRGLHVKRWGIPTLRGRRALSLGILVAISFAFMLAIYCYQMRTAGELNYFYYKAASIVLVTLCPLGTAGLVGIALVLRRLLLNLWSKPRSCTAIGLAASLTISSYFCWLWFGTPLINLYAAPISALLPAEFQGLLELSKVPEKSGSTYIAISAEPVGAYFLNRWLAQTTRSPSTFQSIHLPLQHGAGYLNALHEKARRGEIPGKLVLFDPHNVFGTHCHTWFFDLQEQGKLSIIPERGLKKRIRRCRDLAQRNTLASPLEQERDSSDD